MDYAFPYISLYFFPNPRSRRFSPMFSYRSYIFVVLTFRSIFHFELIFK